MSIQHEKSQSRPRSGKNDDVRKRYDVTPAVLSIKLEADLMREIDAEVLRFSVVTGHTVPRSDVVKDLLREALDARAKLASKSKK